MDLPLRAEGLAQHIPTKYRNDATGEAWTGRGSRPKWLRDALERGAMLEDFLLKEGERQSMDPLRAFQNAARRAHVADAQVAYKTKKPRSPSSTRS